MVFVWTGETEVFEYDDVILKIQSFPRKVGVHYSFPRFIVPWACFKRNSILTITGRCASDRSVS